MTFTRGRSQNLEHNNIQTLEKENNEKVSYYKYLGFWTDDKVSFIVHVEHLIKKLKALLGFSYRYKCCLKTDVKKKKLVQTTFLSVLDYGTSFTGMQLQQLSTVWTQSITGLYILLEMLPSGPITVTCIL